MSNKYLTAAKGRMMGESSTNARRSPTKRAQGIHLLRLRAAVVGRMAAPHLRHGTFSGSLPTDIVEHGDLFQRGQQQFDELLVGGVGEVDLKPGLVFEGDEEAVGVALVVGLG